MDCDALSSRGTAGDCGIAKRLAAKLGQQIQTQFEVVVWRSLQNAPPFEEWLETVLPILLQTQERTLYRAAWMGNC